MAVCRDLEIIGGHRGNDRSFCGDGAWTRAHSRRLHRQPDDRRCNCGYTAGGHRSAASGRLFSQGAVLKSHIYGRTRRILVARVAPRGHRADLRAPAIDLGGRTPHCRHISTLAYRSGRSPWRPAGQRCFSPAHPVHAIANFLTYRACPRASPRRWGGLPDGLGAQGPNPRDRADDPR